MARAGEFIKDLSAQITRNKEGVAALQRFFKTGEGQYGAGDVFIGVSVPANRGVCRKYLDLSITDLETLLESPIHEVRLGAVMIMAYQANSYKTSQEYKKALYNLYLRRTDRINNWDIVDASCRDVVGGYLNNKSRTPLYKLALSDNIWERRIAIVSTWYFIRQSDLQDTSRIAEMLLGDTHDLIHKAVGWMLREMGKKDRSQLIIFLEKHASKMPRTMLRYAIEHLTHEQKIKYLSKKKEK